MELTDQGDLNDSMTQSSHSSDLYYIRPNYQETSMNLDGVKSNDSNQHQLNKIKRDVCLSGFLIFVWICSLCGYAYIDKFYEGIRPQYMILVFSMIGGAGISRFSAVSFSLLDLSKSRKEKQRQVLKTVSFCQILGPFVIAYGLLWQTLLSSNSKSIQMQRMTSIYGIVILMLIPQATQGRQNQRKH